MDSFFTEETADNIEEDSYESAGIPKINPENPFDNFTEYEYYNGDYREIVPQIDIPGCVIPFEPSKREKKKIRHYFNAVGAGVLLNLFASFAIFNIIIFILQQFIFKSDGVSSSEMTSQYLAGVKEYINNSSISIGLCAVIYTLTNTSTFLIGSKATKIKISSYFQTGGVTLTVILSYFVMCMFLSTASNVVNLAFGAVFDNLDTSVGSFDFQSSKTRIVTLLYGCIMAPVAEELMYRGFVLKNLSRVSQRFGIIVSALLFGLMHENFNQFFSTFIIGVFLAHIDIKHNSLLPSIIVHAMINTTSLTVLYSGVLNNIIAVYFVSMGSLSLTIAGVILFAGFYKKNRLPYTMPHQKIRNGTAASSVLLITAIIILFIITIINSFPTLLQEPIISFAE